MKHIFKAGDMKDHRFVVTPQDFAQFQTGLVHKVCATSALVREAEWTTRQFVLDLRDDDEEGVGTYVEIHHRAPALVAEEVLFTGIFESLVGIELSCSFEARVDGRLIAYGKTGQKILKREKIRSIFGHG